MVIGLQSPAFHRSSDFKNGNQRTLKGKLIEGSLFWFFKGLGITFWTVWTLDE